jgi:hypothetical protein
MMGLGKFGSGLAHATVPVVRWTCKSDPCVIGASDQFIPAT